MNADVADETVIEGPGVSVIMVNYNTVQLTIRAVEAVRTSIIDPSLDLEIVVVDNASSDHSVKLLRERFPDITIVPLDDNVGFGRGNNVGVSHARGDLLFLLNTDTEMRAGGIEVLRSKLMERADWGVVAPYLENPDGSYQRSILCFPTLWRIFCEFFWLDRTGLSIFSGPYPNGLDPDREQTIDVANGAALMIRRRVYEEVGGFDPAFFMYFEECDLCRRVADRGYVIGYTPEARVMHLVGASSDAKPWWFFRQMRISRRIYAGKHFSRATRPILAAIVHGGYALRILLFGLIGLFNRRIGTLGRNMFLSYVRENKER